MNEIQIAGLGVSVLITLIMALIFKTTGDKISDRYRPLVAVAFGILIYILYIPYSNNPYNYKSVIDAIVLGLTYGLSAVGMYESTWKVAVKPRVP